MQNIAVISHVDIRQCPLIIHRLTDRQKNRLVIRYSRQSLTYDILLRIRLIRKTWRSWVNVEEEGNARPSSYHPFAAGTAFDKSPDHDTPSVSTGKSEKSIYCSKTGCYLSLTCLSMENGNRCVLEIIVITGPDWTKLGRKISSYF